MKQGILLSLLILVLFMLGFKTHQSTPATEQMVCENLIAGYLKSEGISDYYMANWHHITLADEERYIYYYRVMETYKLRQSDVKQFQCSRFHQQAVYQLSDANDPNHLKLLLQVFSAKQS